MKQADPFYFSKTWKRLRERRLKLDGYTCVVPGCGQPATIVDHIKPRLAGGTDDLFNLRSLCRSHDNQVKEHHKLGGKRSNKGRLVVRGCHPDGSPRDPSSPWYKR